jgi:hypothetical protein
LQTPVCYNIEWPPLVVLVLVNCFKQLQSGPFFIHTVLLTHTVVWANLERILASTSMPLASRTQASTESGKTDLYIWLVKKRTNQNWGPFFSLLVPSSNRGAVDKLRENIGLNINAPGLPHYNRYGKRETWPLNLISSKNFLEFFEILGIRGATFSFFSLSGRKEKESVTLILGSIVGPISVSSWMRAVWSVQLLWAELFEQSSFWTRTVQTVPLKRAALIEQLAQRAELIEELFRSELEINYCTPNTDDRWCS